MDFLCRNGLCDVLHPARQGRNKSIIVVSIKILDTAAFRCCQMRQQGSGCDSFLYGETILRSIRILLLFHFFDGNDFTGKAFDFG